MGKFLIFLTGTILGLIAGGLLTFFFFVGVPAAVEIPGNPIQPPQPNETGGGTARLVVNQQFFDAILTTIFSEMKAPAFPLAENSTTQTNPALAFFQNNQENCAGQITILPEGSGVKTSVRLENGEIKAPLAFQGRRNILGNCIEFAGWAQAGLQLNYEAEQKNVFGQISVETVNLDGVTPLASGIIAQFVQNSLNQRVNPITILRGDQIALNLPIAATGGTLQADVSDIRAEIKEDQLSFFVSYEFKGK